MVPSQDRASVLTTGKQPWWPQRSVGAARWIQDLCTRTCGEVGLFLGKVDDNKFLISIECPDRTECPDPLAVPGLGQRDRRRSRLAFESVRLKIREGEGKFLVSFGGPNFNFKDVRVKT